jgi:hypothetical protein
VLGLIARSLAERPSASTVAELASQIPEAHHERRVDVLSVAEARAMLAGLRSP